MRLSRLSGLGLRELIGRSRQEASKRLDRVRIARNATRDHDMKAVAPDRFFEGAVSPDIPSMFAARMPQATDRAITAANSICEGRLNLLGYREIHLGEPVDWRLDPISGRRSPVVHWSRLDPLDAQAVGDSKIVWELNRQQWLVTLGQAYRLTADERYADACARYVRGWLHANPPGMGINWASSLEVALRLISWCWALVLFRQSRSLSAELSTHMLSSLAAHASHVERYLSYYFSPNTHLTGEALGLFYAGVLFPEFRSARSWRTLGARILVEQSERQVLPDGVYFEQSTCYHRYTVEIYLHFLILAARNSFPVPPAVEERVHRMLDFLLAVRRPDGSMPQIGDTDGGWLLPFTTRAPDDFGGVFSIAAAYFDRADYAWAGDSPSPETAWLLGPPGMKTLDLLRPAPPATAPSRLFPKGGYAVMRSGWERNAHHLVFDVGPLGCPFSGGHGHADLLSLQCSGFGTPYLTDSGTYCYTADARWRDYFRSTQAHSSIVVDGESQASPRGPFTWDRQPRAHLSQWISTDAYDLAEAEHGAYERLSDPVLHRRRVIFYKDKPRYWVIVDDLAGKAEHRIEAGFQFAPVEVSLTPDLWARARGENGSGLLVRAFASVPLKREIREGELDPISGWVSSDYGRRRPAPVLIYSAVAQLPMRIVTLLWPTEDPLSPGPEVSMQMDETLGPVALQLGDGRQIPLRALPCAG